MARPGRRQRPLAHAPLPFVSMSRDQASIDSAVAEVEKRCGGIDILVNNAAIFDMAPIEEITRESYDRIFAVNVGAAVHPAGGGAGP